MSNEPDFIDDFDFGFEFADSDQISTPVEQEVKEERIDTIEEKLDVLLVQLKNGIQTSSNSEDLDLYKEMIEEKVKKQLEQVERLTLPLLYNLKKNPEKEYIYWSNREEKINEQIQRILAVTRD